MWTHFPDVDGAGFRLELFFANNLTNTVELFVSGERICSIAIDKEGSVTKNGQSTTHTCCQQDPTPKVQISWFLPCRSLTQKFTYKHVLYNQHRSIYSTGFALDFASQ